MLNAINTAAEKFARYAIMEGDRVAILSESSREFAIAIVALWKLQAVVVPISTRTPYSVVDELIACVDADHFIDSPRLKHFAQCDESVLRFPEFDSLGLDLQADASILFTSASSGKAKAVLHTIGNHYYSALGSSENIPFGAGDCWQMSLPMYHVSGFSLIMRALVGGASICFADDELPPEATHISVVPTQLRRLIDGGRAERLRQLKAILLGGAAIPRSLLDRCRELELPVHTTYGSTELCSQVVTDGKVLPYREVAIAGDGEIMVKGKTLFKGYVRSGDVELPTDAEGYFATGDIGRFDEQGDLQITGRKDLMFISGGENIYPEEIERVLCDIENIAQAVVVPVGDNEFGNRPAAFIETIDGVDFDSEKIRATLREKFEGFKVPVKFYPMPESESDKLKPNRQELCVLAETSD